VIDRALSGRSDRRLFLVDLAIPRDIEYPPGRHENVTVYDLDSVKKHADSQRQRREAAIPKAEVILETKLSEFVYWFEHVRYEPLYNGLEKPAETIRLQELQQLRDKLPPGLQVELDMTSRQLVDHLLHLKVRSDSDKHE
jgi:glutamyl-tRNA reductase